ncbi:pyridoxal phosphate-dependent aminotransferase [Enterovirga aerilata]|nr:pyridoxal phosphate-dependent aminotransferase [Enterovirga sp. DB1703]
MSLRAGIRPEVERMPESGIVEVANYGRGRDGLIPLWIGEGHRPTPAFIAEAASRALAAGETFYTWQRGIPELREAIARYTGRLFGRAFDPERFYVTVGGMHALQMAMRIVSGPGDEVIVPTPAWPNFEAAVGVNGARAVALPMIPGPDGWVLDLGRLEAAITPRTRALVINSPSNPTGWTASRDDLVRILHLARRHGLWIVADEIYQRFVWDPGLGAETGRTPSFHDVMEEDERILFLQTFSKNWAMTGWRIGWLEAPPELGPVIENLVQYTTSGVPAFLQRAAVVALEEGEGLVEEHIALARHNRQIVCEGLRATNVVELPSPPGAFYAFFGVDGVSDTRRLALDLIDHANVGLAPGTAFGAGGAAYLRLCFLRDTAVLEEAIGRLAAALPRLASRRAA